MKLSIVVRRLLLTIRTVASIICLTAPAVEAQCTAYGDPPATLIANIVPLCSRGTRLGPWNDADGTPRYACLYEPEAASASAPLPLLVFLQPWVMTRKTAAVGLQITGWIVLTLALAVISTGGAAAQVKLGDFITAEDAIRVKDLISPGVYWRVRNGWTMKIQPSGLPGQRRQHRRTAGTFAILRFADAERAQEGVLVHQHRCGLAG